MLIKFSNDTAALLRAELAEFKQLNEPNETETQFDLSKVKKLKGFRTELVKNWLKCIQQLDQLIQQQGKEKDYAREKIKVLIQALKHYKTSCEYYPRLKDFLNSIPDNTDGIVGFMLIASSLIAYLSLPFIVVPLFIFSWIVLDLVFNNRTAAKTLETSIWTIEEEITTLREANSILNIQLAVSQIPIQIQRSQAIPIPSTSSAYSPGFYRSMENQSIENKPSPTNSLFASFSSTSSS